jgi:hypothetical protein
MALFRSDPPPPEWAPFMKPREFARFMKGVRADLKRRGIEHEIDGAQIVTADGRYGLITLAQLVHEQGPDVIVGHFNVLFAPHPETPPTFEEAAPLLRVRLLHPDLIDGARPPVVRRPLADLALALALDHPEIIGFVRDEDIERWGRPFDELLALGLEQQDREEPATVVHHQMKDGTTLLAYTGSSLYTSTHALWAPDGLVAVPHRHSVICHPIRDLQVMDALGYMAGMARRMYVEGPGSISDQLYWKRGEDFMLIPVEHTAGDPLVHAPDEFVAMLNELG